MKLKRFLSAFLAVIMLLPSFTVFTSANTSAVSGSDGASSELDAQIAGARGGAKAIVSMTYDDGQYKTAKWMNEMFEKYDLKASCMLVVKNQAGASDPTLWEEIFEKGYLSPENHSMTHLVLPGTEWSKYEDNKQNNTPENFQYELLDSKEKLEELFGQPVVTFAPSNNTLWWEATDIVKANYYAMRKGVRGKVQSFEPIEGSDAAGGWYNLYMRGIDNTTLEENKSYVQMCIDQGGWFISMTHAVIDDSDDPTKPERFEAFYQFLAEKQAKNEVWVTTFAEATKYLRERQNSSVVALLDGNKITVNLDTADETGDGLALDKDIFNVPLTLKIEVPKHWGAVSYEFDGETLYSKSFTESGKSYVYVDAYPDSEVVLSTVEFAQTSYSPENAGYVNESGIFFKDELSVGGSLVSNESFAVSYLSFDVPFYVLNSAVSATLSLNVSQSIGRNVKIYGLTKEAMHGVYSFKDMPGIQSGQGVDLASVFGASALYSGVVGDGKTDVSIYDYVDSVNGDCVFMIVSDGVYEGEFLSVDSAQLNLFMPAEYDFSRITPKTSLIIADGLQMCFYINAFDDVIGAEGNGLSYSEDNIYEARVETLDGALYYAFPVNFSPYDLNEAVTLNLRVKGSGRYFITHEYSVVLFDYMKTLLNSDEYKDSHELALDVLSYIRSAARCTDPNVDTTELNTLLWDHMYYPGANMPTDQRVFEPDAEIVTDVFASVTDRVEITLTPTEQYSAKGGTFEFKTGGVALNAQKLDSGAYILRIPIHLISRKLSIEFTDVDGTKIYTEFNLRYVMNTESDLYVKDALDKLMHLSESALEYLQAMQ